MSENNLQPTQMSVAKHDERKPVICPWCGWDMVAREGQDIFHGKYNVYVCDGCEATSPIAYSEDTAYAAATKRPPNLPLTREQAEAMDDLDAVWMHLEMSDHILVSSVKSILTSSMPVPVGAIMFARKPTPEDIAAARAGKGEEHA